jgi:hypothetical protein
MAARPKLTASRETRLLALLAFGESFAASCRAINVSSTAVRKHAARHPLFAERLRDAREQRTSALDSIDALDWRSAARRLETEHPQRWSLRDDGGDPLVAFDFDPLGET